jgi:cytosine/uracil/thiamine/allantoin permease
LLIAKFWKFRHPVSGEFVAQQNFAVIRESSQNSLFRSAAWISIQKQNISINWEGHEGFIKAFDTKALGIRQFARNGKHRKKGKRGHKSRLPMVIHLFSL